jgi:magnesium-transporting ATPase (P-type)
MSFLMKHLDGLMAMEWKTIVVICVLCGMACYFLKEYLANPPMIIFVYPVLVFLSMLVQYLFTLADLFAPTKLDQWLMWTILATICGTMLGTCLIGALVKIKERPGRAKPKATVRTLSR